ncbi:MAG: hypothetical protein GYA52_00245 [Chloroflexi bacterium]|nr:hypothetical protein [Chloroflexota bacterium]
MIQKNLINKKKKPESSVFSSRRVQIIAATLIGLFLVGSLVACGPQSPASTPTTIPTPTPEPPQPETALENALHQFDSAQSFTENYSYVSTDTTGKNTIRKSVHSVKQVDQISLWENLELPADDVTESTHLCIKEACFTTDATGLLKPIQSSYVPVRPTIESVNMEFSEIQNATYSYVGEDTLDGIRVFKYEMTVAKEVVDAYNAERPQIWFIQTIIDPYPQVTFFVNVEDGYLVRMQESYNLDTNYEFMGETTNYQSQAEIVKDFSGWNTTTVIIPEYVDTQNTEWQPYTGAYASAVSFEFPKVYFLTEYSGYPSLETPSGSQMDFTIYETIALLSDDQYSDLCADVFHEFVLAFDNMSPTLERAEWIQTDNFNFCKGVINTSDGQRVEYLFNEPMAVAGAAGRLLPETFRIIIYPVESDDVDTIFWDVIQTIRIGGTE